MQRTQSPQQLSQVQMAVNGGIVEVWLHRNIEQVTDEDGNAAWVADQVHGILPASTTGAYVSANFDALWDEWDDTPMMQRVREIAESATDGLVGTTEMAPVEDEVATTNHPVGTYLVVGGTLCKVTVPIATGEVIRIGTNVAATTVAAEMLAIAQM